jgi:hypothetical protein
MSKYYLKVIVPQKDMKDVLLFGTDKCKGPCIKISSVKQNTCKAFNLYYSGVGIISTNLLVLFYDAL